MLTAALIQSVLPFVDDEGHEITDEEGIGAIEPWASGFFLGARYWLDLIPEDAEEESFRHFSRIARYASLEAENEAEEANLAEILAAAGDKPKDLGDALYAVVESVFALKQILRPNKPVRREAPRVGRNDPCPCGSGKKYKQCCGKKN